MICSVRHIPAALIILPSRQISGLKIIGIFLAVICLQLNFLQRNLLFRFYFIRSLNRAVFQINLVKPDIAALANCYIRCCLFIRCFAHIFIIRPVLAVIIHRIQPLERIPLRSRESVGARCESCINLRSGHFCAVIVKICVFLLILRIFQGPAVKVNNNRLTFPGLLPYCRGCCRRVFRCQISRSFSVHCRICHSIDNGTAVHILIFFQKRSVIL